MAKTEVVEPKTATVYAKAEDKIGIPSTYSSVTIACSVTRTVEDNGDESVQAELKKNLFLVEEVLAEERASVLATIQAQA